MNNKDTVFISYSKVDIDFAKKIYFDLKEAGANPWMDIENLLPGQNWKETIARTIRKCNFFIALISSSSISKRGFVQKEIKIALDVLSEIPQNDIFIIPVRIHECVPNDDILQNLHWVDIFISYEQSIKQILRVIKPDYFENQDINEGQNILGNEILRNYCL